MNTPRCAGGAGFAPTGYATRLRDGRVLLTAGGNGDGLNPSTEIYDPATGSWSVTGSTSRLYEFGAVTLLPSGKVLVVGEQGGGTSAEVYDPSTGAWSFAAAAPRPAEGGTATLLRSGRVLVAGVGFCTDAADVYDPAIDAWIPAVPMLVPQQFPAAVLIEPYGQVLVVEGDRCVEGGAGAHAELFTE
jgi:hypothetical protein